jgi:translation initiation factor 5B
MLQEQSFNACLYWEGEDVKTHIPIVPTSGVTGEGIPDLLSVIVNYTSRYMKKKFLQKDQFNCTVMEVKMIEVIVFHLS